MTGTLVAQAIPVCISPILTRFYSPEDFGLYALFISISTILSIGTTGRYELAILLPETERDAFQIVGVTAYITILVSSFSLLALFIWKDILAGWLGNAAIAPWLYLIPLSMFLTGLYQAFYYWMNRRKEFKILALNRISQSSGTALVNLGFSSWGPAGLICGTLLGQGIGVGFLGRQILKKNRNEKYAFQRQRMMEQAKKYLKFPKYSILADSINNAANQVPVILLMNFFGSSIVGFFNLTQRVLAAPISIAATSVLDVFKQQASRDFVTLGNCRAIYLKTFKNLILISILPFAGLFFFAPQLFTFIFGPQWRISGEFARILTILFFLRFTVSPLSYVLYIAGKQNYDLFWQMGLFVVTTISIASGAYLGKAEYSIALFSLSYSGMYLIYLFMSYHFSKGERKMGNNSPG